MSKKTVLVCGGMRGSAVLVGDLPEGVDEVNIGKPYTLENARMVLYWSEECKGLLGLAQNGPKSGTRLSGSVATVTDAIAHQCMPLSDDVAEAFRGWEG